MAVRAALDRRTRCGRHLVGSRQRPSRRAVIEFPIGPCRGVVTGGTQRRRKRCRHVIRNGRAQGLRAIPIRSMASVTICVRARQVVVIVRVTLRTGRRCMCTCECKSRCRMVERSDVRPGNCVVALGAICHREHRTCCGVRRIICLLPRAEVTPRISTIRGGNLQVVVVVDVTACARHRRMTIRQWKSRRTVIERRVRPGRRAMAL